jgi:uncharacterized protein YggE
MIGTTTALRPIAVAAIAVGMCAAGTVQAMAATPGATVTVYGNGVAAGTPDELQLSLEVDTHDTSVSAALDSANQDMRRVRDALLAAGVAAADLQTSGLSIRAHYDQQGMVACYDVSESLNAELRDLSTAGQTITSAVDAGGNSVRVNNVSLDLDDQSAGLIATARASAIADARTRAWQYARAAHRRLGRVLSISETGSAVPVYPNALFSARSAVPISPGTLRVTASVTVVYRLR